MTDIHRSAFPLPFGAPATHDPAASSRWMLALAVAIALAVFSFDAFTRYQVAVAVLYVLVVQLVAVSGSARLTVLASLACVALTLLAFVLTHEPASTVGALGRCMVSLLAIAAATALSMRHLRTDRRMREQIELLNLSHDAIVIYDMRGVVTFWNRGAESLYGWQAAQAVGRDFHALTDTRFPQPDEAVYETLSRQGRWEGEVERRHRDGRDLIVASRIALWRDQRGHAIALMATNNDITERRRAEIELARNEAFLADAQRLSKTGSVLRYADSYEMNWSDEAFRVLGFGTEEIPSFDRVLQRTHPEDLPIVQGMDAAIRRGEPVIDGKHRLLMPDGEVKHVHFVARLNNRPGHRAEYVGALMDISAAVAAQEALQRSLTELAHVSRLTTLGGLATTVAHEVTQPIAAIVTCGDSALRWLDRPDPDVAEARQSVEQMIRDAQRASEIVRQIRGMAQKREPQWAPVAVNTLVRESLSLLARECATHQVQPDVQLSDEEWIVPGDPVQLQQVLVNLLVNAMQAMDDAGSNPRVLRVGTARADASHVRIVVSDTGPGFAGGDAERIFRAFHTTKKDGVGMGLSICRSIVEAHGGQIWATSGNPGASFHVELPLRNEGES
ncbi:PAS domain-containing sensor histidine kinase [Cupriavidus agavae]|uniref:histidine kinase n=1 Tax=Cupriavidus agavae TaxID=1001822 RepID=A0A4Q7S060_9BURK|nr:ATP-binding protein [Cupriavidus agavae]RZT39504.1 PAS domain S-box-containing protein [Cupriavidus agavae]